MAASMDWGFWLSQDPALCSHLYMQGAAWFETLCGCTACIGPQFTEERSAGSNRKQHAMAVSHVAQSDLGVLCPGVCLGRTLWLACPSCTHESHPRVCNCLFLCVEAKWPYHKVLPKW